MHCTPNSTVILFRGGRLPSWHALTPGERTEFERIHVDLMLDIAERHGLERLAGFRLLGPQGSWERFWTIAFPSADGAAAWIKAEMAPPYGRYGFYEYNLARSLSVDVLGRRGK